MVTRRAKNKAVWETTPYHPSFLDFKALKDNSERMLKPMRQLLEQRQRDSKRLNHFEESLKEATTYLNVLEGQTQTNKENIIQLRETVTLDNTQGIRDLKLGLNAIAEMISEFTTLGDNLAKSINGLAEQFGELNAKLSGLYDLQKLELEKTLEFFRKVEAQFQGGLR